MMNTCGSLLRELEEIWQEIGESKDDKDRMLSELEKECLQVYQKKFEEVSRVRAQLHHELATKEAELAALMASLGEHNLQSQMEKRSVSLKKQLDVVSPLLENLRNKKEERMKQFSDVLLEMKKLSAEIAGYSSHNDSFRLDEHDLSSRRLNEFRAQLQIVQKEKSDRLSKVLEYINDVHSLCGVLELDFGKIVDEVHPSLRDKGRGKSTSISDSTIEGLAQTVLKLKTEKQVRMQKLQGAIESLLKLWNLMETSEQERLPFKRFKGILGSKDQDAVLYGLLSLKIIEQTEAEVERLTRIKASRMKEIATRRRTELEEICREAHIEVDTSTSLEKCYALIDSGLVDPVEFVANFEAQIVKAREEAISRREILDKINRWLAICEEENWLEVYNQDGNRYGGRGAHVNRKRAEKARMLVSKIPDMVDNLIAKTYAWEDEHDMGFLYDGVRLASILEEYKNERLQKYEEGRQLRDSRKLQRESVFESKSSPRRSNNHNARTTWYNGRGNGYMNSPSRQNFSDGTMEQLTPHSFSSPKKNYFKEMMTRLSTTKLNQSKLWI
ncbi:putative microtubule-associated protein, MAP65/Ase1/PRC1 [Dioscorea sansibarensis]